MNTNKYNDSKIYKIVSPHTDKIYIGSTTKSINERLKHHEYDYKRYLITGNHYLSSFEIIKLNDYDIVLLENVNVETKKDLYEIETKHIKNSDKIVNKYMPLIESRENYMKNYQKIYRKANSVSIDCVCGGKYKQPHKTHHFKSKLHLDYENVNKLLIIFY